MAIQTVFTAPVLVNILLLFTRHMPNFASYSPWEDASSNAIRPAGNALSQLALEIAKSRYNRRNQTALMGLQLEKLQQQELLNQAHERVMNTEAPMNEAHTQVYSNQAQHQASVDEAARQLQTSVVANDDPNPMQDGPTLAAQASWLAARQHGAAALVAGLHGNPSTAFPVHNVGPNNVAMDPMSGVQVGQGPTVLAPGGMYQQPGQQPVINPRPYFAPAGSTPMGPTGQPEGPQTGFRPTSAGSRSSAVDASLIRLLGEGNIDAPGSVTNKNTGAVSNIRASPLYIAATNALQRSMAPSTSPQAGPPQAGIPQPPESHSPQEADLMQQANDAISKGADPDAVKARLKSMGYNPQ